MPLKTTLTALALALMPVLGAAEGCSDRSHQAQSCDVARADSDHKFGHLSLIAQYAVKSV